MKGPVISVIVPVYKVEKYLRRCLDSITEQTYTNLEVILVDDGSPDRCGEICDEYAAKDVRFLVIHTRNGGVGVARNIGLSKCHGKYIMFVDSDDYLEPNMCEMLLDAIKKNNSCIAVCGFFVDDESGKRRIVGPSQYTSLSGKESVIKYFSGSGSTYLVNVWNKLYDKRIFDKNSILRFPSDMRYEDEFISYKILYHASKIVFIRPALYHYVQHAESFMHTLNLDDMMARRTCLMEYYRWAKEEAPDMRDLIEYAGIRIFNGFVWSYVQYGEPESLRTMVHELNQFILGQTHHFLKNPYKNLKSIKNYYLMKWGLFIAIKRFSLKKGK